MFTMRNGRQPKRSASQPKNSAPSGRMARVRKIPSATALMSTRNSPAIAFSEKTKMKKSNASSDQPASDATNVCRWDLVRFPNGSSRLMRRPGSALLAADHALGRLPRAPRRRRRLLHHPRDRLLLELLHRHLDRLLELRVVAGDHV